MDSESGQHNLTFVFVGMNQVSAHMNKRMSIYIYIYIYICVCIYIYIYIHIQTYIPAFWSVPASVELPDDLSSESLVNNFFA